MLIERKIHWLVGIASILLLVVLLAGCGKSTGQENKNKPAAEKKITLKLAHSFPENHYLAKEGGVYWAERVKELTNGKVDFEYYPAEQMGKADALLDQVKNKVVDVAYVGVGYFSDKLPLSTVGQLPADYLSTVQGSKAYWKVINDLLLEKEFLANNVRPVFAAVLPPYQIVTLNKKVNSLGDLKGVKIRTAGIQSLICEAIGATPVSLPAPEIFTAMQRKTLDGTFLPFTSFKPYQIEKIAKFSTSNVNMGTFAVTYCINENVWKSLPKDVQEAMVKAGNETIEHMCKYQDENVEKLGKEFKEMGIDIYEVDQKTLSAMNEKIKPILDDWAKKLDKRGLPGTEVLKAYQKAAAEAK
ncbi:MAG: TRAP transporter substrate-binding protein [Desulfotomaculales bacterium]